ncbi:MAG: acyl-CoA thioesterase [Saprospiraceae bacterium]|nr:acyl-CoA thioesterase [Saprospiraceae bacterium]
MNKKPSSSYKIRFKDCDPLGHLYNTRFLDYMLEAREDQIIDEYNIDLHDYATNKRMAWVIVHHEIAYLKEAVRNERVIINSSLLSYSEKSLKNEYTMWDINESVLKAIMWTSFLHVDLNIKKTCSHPQDISEKLALFVNPIDQTSLQERIQYLKAQTK